MRKREVAFVVPAKFKAFTQELKNLEEFEDIPVLTMNTTKINFYCWLRTALQLLQSIFIVLWKYSNNCCTAAVVLIQGWYLLTFPPYVRHLIEDGAFFVDSTYLSKYSTLQILLLGRVAEVQTLFFALN